jgi:polyketide synthase PksN
MDKKRQELIDAVAAHRLVAQKIAGEAKVASPEREPIAIIGLSGYLPGCMSVQEFWRALDRDQPLIEEVPPRRFACAPIYDATGNDPEKTRSKWGGFIPVIEDFDPELFGITLTDAERMDPRQRLLLMSVYNTLEDAGYAPSQLKESQSGVFIAIEDNEYRQNLEEAGIAIAEPFSHAVSMVASRISYFFDFRGPSEVVNTMCSGAAVALHRAVMALRAGEIDQAIVGAANLILRPDLHVSLSRLRQLSPSGTVSSFGADASGYVRAEGVASVLLKPLAQAERDGDAIYAVIKNSAVGFNGQGGTSIAAPNAMSHSELIRRCYAAVDVDPRRVGYVEAQGMGNQVADIAEWKACNQALASLARDKGITLTPGHCHVSTLKPMIGHMHSASALGALFKIIRSLQTDRIHKILDFATPNPYLELADQPCRLAVETVVWPRPEAPRLAGLHSYGSGGVNAHVLIEEYRAGEPRAAAPASAPQLVPLSAARAELLVGMAERLRDALDEAPSPGLTSIARTLQHGRDEMRFRAAFVADSVAGLKRQLQAYVDSRRDVLDGPDDKSELERLAREWASGRVSLRGRGADKTTKARLPAYPFAKTRCWIDGATVEHAIFRSGRVAGEPLALRLFLDGNEPFFSDHRVKDRPIFPGAGYLELGWLAAQACNLGPIDRLSDVVWQSPLYGDAVTDVRLALTPGEAGSAELTVFSPSPSAADGRLVHARARLGRGAAAATARLPLGLIAARCAHVLDGESVYRLLDRSGLNYGRSFRGIVNCRLGADEALATVKLPHGLSVAGGVALHPTLLDSALQSCVLLLRERLQLTALIPFALAEAIVTAPLAEELVVHSRLAPAATTQAPLIDCDLCTPDGDVLVSLRGLHCRPIAEAAEVELEQQLWREEDELGPATAHRCISLRLGDGLDIEGAEPLRVDARDPVAALLKVIAVVSEKLRATLAADGDSRCLVDIWCDETLDRSIAEGIVSFLKSLRQEHPHVAGKLVRLEDRGDGERGRRAIVTRERASGSDAAVLYRDGKRHVRAAARLSAPLPVARDVLGERGKTYCIVGGGALGRELAHWLIENFDAAVIIASRSGQAAAAAPAHERIRWRALDVTDAERVADFVAALEAEPALEGIFFTAGVVQPRATLEKTSAERRDVIVPKCQGALSLLRHSRALPCRFVALFSSQAFQGEYQNSDYAAANGFLNGLAPEHGTTEPPRFTNRHGQPISVVSINWPQWRDGAMRLPDDIAQLMRHTQRVVPLPNHVGFNVLRDVLRSGVGQVAVQYRLAAAPAPPAAARAPEAVAVAPAASPSAQARAEQIVRDVVATFLKKPPQALDMSGNFAALGLDSLSVVSLSLALQRRHGLRVPPALFFEHPSPGELQAHIAGLLSDAPPPAIATEPARAHDGERQAIAIVGLHARFPGAADVDTFWKNIVAGRRCIGEVPAARREQYASAGGVAAARYGGFIEGVDEFDPLFFSIAPQEAELMDPQQRLLMMSVWSALENGGLVPEQFAQRPTGVFVAAAPGEYQTLVGVPPDHALGTTAVTASIAPNRISHVFNFKGPSEYCDTACSSVLTALHRALQSIRRGECEQAIVTAVNLLLAPAAFTGFAAMEYLSPDGSCRPFQAGANGFVRSEGVGTIVLKPLERATADGDIIYALVKGSGVAHGGRALSLTAPNVKGMKQAIVAAYRDAGVDARSVSYVEMHGVGSPVADAAEVAALSSALGEAGPAATPCHLSSLKPCIGHGELVSGMAALIKAVSALRHRVIPGLPGFTQLHEDISLDDGRLRIAATSQPWDAAPRRAAVNSFGFGGVNAHVILEERVTNDETAERGEPQIFVFSAKSGDRLRALVQQMASWLRATERPSLADVAYTLQTGREAFGARLAVVAKDVEQLHERLSAYLDGPATEPPVAPGIYAHQLDAALPLARLLDGTVGQALLEPLIAARALDKIAEYWTLGGIVPWPRLHAASRVKRIPLPTYPFKQDRYWFTGVKAPAAAAAHSLCERTRAFLSQALSLPPSQLGDRAPLAQLGVDSLVLVKLARALEQWSGVAVPLRTLLDLKTIEAIAAHVEGRGPALDGLDLFKQGMLSLDDIAKQLEEELHEPA